MAHPCGLQDINIRLLHFLMLMKLSILDDKCEKCALSLLVPFPVGSLEIFK